MKFFHARLVCSSETVSYNDLHSLQSFVSFMVFLLFRPTIVSENTMFCYILF